MEPKNYKRYLSFIDFIGINPSLHILKYDNYKTTPSFIISIIILLICISFVIFSFIEFLNQTPDLIYYKSMDPKTKKKIFLSDSFLIFRILNSCSNITKEDISINYYSKEKPYSLDFEYCEIGKNIDYKFNNDISNNDESNLQIDLFKEKTPNCKNEETMISIITENDIMNSNDKNNPIVPYYYYFEKVFVNNDIIFINYNYQYIKFDSDEGIFFQNYKTHNAIGFSDLEYDVQNYDLDFLLINFTFNINKFNYELYMRKYQKLQSLLADIMSIINLSVTIGKSISHILLNKVMVRDILINIIDNNYNKKKNVTSNDYNIKKKLNNSDIKEKNKFNLEKTNIKSGVSDIEKINKSNINNLNLSRHKTNTKIRALKSINCFQFIKSLFCYEDIKSKLINICFNLI